MAETAPTPHSPIIAGSVSKVVRQRAATSDDEVVEVGRRPTPVRASVPSVPQPQQALAAAQTVAHKGVAGVVTLAIIGWTWPFYIGQLVGAVFCIMGIATGVAGEEYFWGLFNWLGLTGEVAELFIGAGIGISLVFGIIQLLIAVFFYTVRGISLFDGYSIIIMAVVVGCLVTPGINLLPLVWLWCAYITLSQR